MGGGGEEIEDEIEDERDRQWSGWVMDEEEEKGFQMTGAHHWSAFDSTSVGDGLSGRLSLPPNVASHL